MTTKSKLAIVAACAVATAIAVGIGIAAPGTALTNVPLANTKSDAYAPASALSPELRQIAVAQGSTRVENSSSAVSYYGYDNDATNAVGEPVMVPTAANPTEAHKTEPDKNTYLVFKNGLLGADPSQNYGTHFLFQGHEGGSPGYITRVNLDADAAHRVTVLATTDSTGAPLATIDGSTWDPFAQRLVFTTENPNAPTYQATPGYPSVVDDISGAVGRGGYEGVQNDSDGNLWIVEDIGGSSKKNDANVTTTAKRPNSFVYRFLPYDKTDLTRGKLQALQVLEQDGVTPITFDSQAALGSADQVALHTYGQSFATRWVTIHDTAIDGTAPFNANLAAKAANATPFKRPENGVFRPGSNFTEFYFDETGDTNATSPENACCGGWSSVMKLTQASASASSGTITMFYNGDQAHAGFDNVTFLSKDRIAFVEDAGDTLHTQRNALDSGFVLDATVDYSNAANQPVRWLAEGRDASAAIDGSASPTGFGKNDGDNEITGAVMSDGDPTAAGLLGAKIPALENPNWRWFYTQQHGDNTTYEVVRAS